MFIQLALLVAFHAHSADAKTLIVPAPTPDENDCADGDIDMLHSLPASPA
jgi:hypothetical protein